jgi:triacylglycerol lipase
VNIVAHSMGGLDARYAIARLGLASRVASLTTIGTPHVGTPLADLGTAVLGEQLGLRRALARFGVGLDAFYDLTSERVAALNAAAPDAHGVAYASVVGAVQARRRTHPLLLPGWLYLRAAAGENDGLVPADAQRWGEVLARIDADHWAQIGWSRHFDAAAFYDGLAAELRGRGF